MLISLLFWLSLFLQWGILTIRAELRDVSHTWNSYKKKQSISLLSPHAVNQTLPLKSNHKHVSFLSKNHVTEKCLVIRKEFFLFQELGSWSKPSPHPSKNLNLVFFFLLFWDQSGNRQLRDSNTQKRPLLAKLLKHRHANANQSQGASFKSREIEKVDLFFQLEVINQRYFYPQIKVH